MRYYTFDPDSGAHVGAFEPQVDPLESKNAGKLIYCCAPPNCTPDEPPVVASGEVALWDGSSWSMAADRRGETWWDGESAVVVDFIGDPAERGLTADRVVKVTAARIKGECRIRILASLGETAQSNLMARAAVGMLTAEQIAAYKSGLEWIKAMRDRCSELVAASEPTFRDDKHWPECPAEVAALAASF